MTYNQRKTDEYIDSKLRKAEMRKPSSDFTSLVMNKVKAEHALAMKELKREKKVKWFIGSFISLVLGFTFVAAYFSKPSSKTTTDTNSFNIGPAVEKSTGLVDTLVFYIEMAFNTVADLFGLSSSPQSVKIGVVLAIAVALFFLAERFVIRNRFKTIGNMK